jgi:ABC-type glutathione transport system ATPase component
MWLDPAIFRQQLTEMLDRRAAGSHDCFFNKEQTVQWLQGTGGILSITGRSGYGKTVLAASVVERVSQNLQPSHFIGYAFCLKLSVAAILRSLIWQIVQNRNITTNQKARILEVYREHSTAGSHRVLPDNQELLVFRELYTQILQPYGHVTYSALGILYWAPQET